MEGGHANLRRTITEPDFAILAQVPYFVPPNTSHTDHTEPVRPGITGTNLNLVPTPAQFAARVQQAWPNCNVRVVLLLIGRKPGLASWEEVKVAPT